MSLEQNAVQSQTSYKQGGVSGKMDDKGKDEKVTERPKSPSFGGAIEDKITHINSNITPNLKPPFEITGVA